MAPRKSMAMRRQMTNTRQSQRLVPIPAESIEPVRPTLLPTKVRHLEAACAIMLWIAYFPLMFFVHSDALNVCILVLVVFLMIHAYTMRPYCTEFDEDDEEAMMEMSLSNDAPQTPPMDKDSLEAWKLVGLLTILICTVGSIISFSMGGGDVLHSWLTIKKSGCSVAELAKLQNDFARFHCSDGFVDLNQQRSLMTKGGILVKTYTAYRIAPVYLQNQPTKTDLPVAWVVSKNQKLTEKPCGDDGLCGIFASKYGAESDQASYKALKTVARDEVIKAGASDKFDQDSIPAVVLTSLVDPEGKASYFYVGILFYCIVLFGLCNTQSQWLREPASKLDADRICGVNRPGYDQLNEDNARGAAEE